jgi:regulator of sigma E protease
MVAFGLGFVIFVHELGHFLVAKACGVKCDKFYLGFDIAGLKFCKFQWGETEYGIGILPLGGYVKMLGQEDNPAKLREELERAKAEGGGRKAEEVASQSEIQNLKSEISNPQSLIPNPPSLDPRSFLAKSIPQRMAIISAGVIMNMIFAFLMAVVAFSMGVEQIPCVVGAVFPGEPAWQADIRVGDQIEKIAGKKMWQFRDLQTAIALGDIDQAKGVPIEVRRPGVKEPLTLNVKPDASRGASMIGVSGGKTTQLLENRPTWLIQKCDPVTPHSPAALAKPPFCNSDKIIRIDDVKIDNYSQINTELARKVDREITVAVSRDEGPDAKSLIATSVKRNPMRALGVVMKMGEITAVQAGSPAAAAGVLPGDLIRKIDDNPVSDPMMLPDVLRRRAGETVELTVQREESKTPLVLSVRLREPIGYYPSGEMILLDSPVEVSALGVTYRVLNRVDRVAEGSPAAKTGLLPEDLVVRAKVIPPAGGTSQDSEGDHKEQTLPFDEKNRNWPALCSAIQVWPAGTTVELTVLRQGNEKTVTLTPVEAADWFNPDRGFDFELMTFAHRAETFGDAVKLGGKETLVNTTIVYKSLKKLGKGEVSARGLAGPVKILQMAGIAADRGTSSLLLFLTLLSANLAVLNFLPIPLLDGGLMVFLLYEGIRGKPADERVQVVLTYLGLFFIIVLMVWVFGLDFGWIARH